MPTPTTLTEVTLTILTLSGGTLGTNFILETPREALQRPTDSHCPMQIVTVQPDFRLLILGGTTTGSNDPLIDELEGDAEAEHQWLIVPQSILANDPVPGTQLIGSLYTPPSGPVIVVPL